MQRAGDIDGKHGLLLSANRRALLESMLAAKQGKVGVETDSHRIPRRNSTAPAPLSHAQQRLWFLHQLAPDSAFYNVPVVTRLVGHVSAAILQRALDAIVLRHEILRTCFPVVGGTPVQVVATEAHVPLSIVDVSARPAIERRVEAQRLADQEASVPFDLAGGPVMRAMLLRLGEVDHWFVMTLHHIVADGWSMDVLSHELRELCAAFAAGRPSPLPPLPVQYADFAVWQREWLRGSRLEKQMAYWRTQLADLPSVPLMTDRPRGTEPDFRGGFLSFSIPDSASTALRALASEQNATLFMTLLASFYVLLSRYTGQHDLVVGAPIANRTHNDLEPLIGFFVNTLVLRADLSGSPNFRTVIDRVRRISLDAYAHQDVPFERLVEELQPQRDISRNPLFQIGFVLQNAWDSTRAGHSEPDDQPSVQRGTAIFDLAIHLWERGSAIAGGIEYSTALFEASTLERLSEHFLTLLEGIALNPDADIAELPILRSSERHRVAVAWNRTQAPYADHSCFHELVEAQAAATPHAIALKDSRESVTYHQMSERATVIAHRLNAMGVSKGSLVLLCLERSVNLVVGLLAILKTGAVYVPLDPTCPAERLKFIAADTAARVMITTRDLMEGDVGAALADVELKWQDINEAARDAPSSCSIAAPGEAPVGPEDLAYVIYTSGSTGKPKGVLIEHRGLCNVVAAQQSILGVGPGSRVLQFASIGFDASIFEISMAIASGGTLHIPPPHMLPGTELMDYLRHERVSVVTLSPTALSAMPQGPLPDLTLLTVAGEACPPALVARWVEGRRFLNLYGPTESTIWATFAECVGSDGKVSIGCPIQNIQTYILDTNGRPVPIGVRGEIWLGGVGLARAYLNRAQLTAERFQSITINETPERLYRTGDLGRFCPDGRIEFLGRSDHQVKIRGHRVELGEIEATLRSNPCLSDAVVAVREDQPGDKRLVAYVTVAHDIAAADRDAHEQMAVEQISHWQRIYESVYGEAHSSVDPTFNITGWNSSYTGQPIPAPEMREWLDATVTRVRRLEPKRILEIGCGTGLLLLRLAPGCVTYTATDFSSAAIRYVEQHLPMELRDRDSVRLLHRHADDFSDLHAGADDMVILNSVVQYFPSAEYLRRVIMAAVRAVTPRGTVFIGDVRNLALLELFSLSVELAHAQEELTVEALRDRVARRLLLENELAVAPEFFHALRTDLPEIHRIEVLPKRGRHVNELSTYRYDVVLYIGDESRTVAPAMPLGWGREMPGIDALRRRVEQARDTDIYVTGIPNARLERELLTKATLAQLAASDTVGDLRRHLDSSPKGVDPEDIAQLGESTGYAVELFLPMGADPGTYEAVFSRGAVSGLRQPPSLQAATNARARSTPSHYTNNPLRGVFLRTLVPRIRAHLESRLPDPFIPSQYVLLERLPQTPSGKLDRARLPAPDRARPDLGVEYIAPAVAIERTIARVWSEVLGVDRVGVLDNFFELGGDSILAIQIVSKARSAGIDISPRHLFEHQTIEALGRVCRVSHSLLHTEQEVVPGPVPLTPIEHWFFEQNLAERHHFNQAVMIPLAQLLDFERLRESVRHVMRHHDALRLRFQCHDGLWLQTCPPPDDDAPPITFVDLSGESGNSQAASIERIGAEAHASLNLEKGPLVRIVAINRGPYYPGELLIVAHHLSVDAVSWGILLDDLRSAYDQLTRGDEVRLPPKTTSFGRWAELLTQYASSTDAQEELAYWRHLAAHSSSEFPIDHNTGENTVASTRTVTVSLTADQTSVLVTKLADGKNTRVDEVLLAALVRAVATSTDQRSLLVDVERHGREHLFPGVDLSRTVGWFTSIVPMCVECRPDAGAEDTLLRVRELTRAIPNHGIGVGPLRYLSQRTDVIRDLEPLTHAPVAFNYLGQVARAVQGPAERVLETGPTRGPRNTRRHLLEINAHTANQRLTVEFQYSENFHRRATIQGLADHFTAVIADLVATGRLARPRYATSDFKHARISEKDLAKLMGDLAAKQGRTGHE